MRHKIASSRNDRGVTRQIKDVERLAHAITLLSDTKRRLEETMPEMLTLVLNPLISRNHTPIGDPPDYDYAGTNSPELECARQVRLYFTLPQIESVLKALDLLDSELGFSNVTDAEEPQWRNNVRTAFFLSLTAQSDPESLEVTADTVRELTTHMVHIFSSIVCDFGENPYKTAVQKLRLELPPYKLELLNKVLSEIRTFQSHSIIIRKFMKAPIAVTIWKAAEKMTPRAASHFKMLRKESVATPKLTSLIPAQSVPTSPVQSAFTALPSAFFY